eukprot:CAMPEP_0114334864 /NCGR_PEP_ID=MMETSP0101-20121206/4668_1 /TAXON_ID=38822 ORGANISM="Pteridomonas danica, Strain PT" /NCGR_SAMPLE_ID=MMETSP0101 /ASSEMBLY_ACC=CAM_ASM_000211 /LENGTH=460 /DNA_ID=CAMNT_0001466283 /DNA_START=304 /DNA_END=1683 /DNA_ORIENTATION=-
MTKSASHLVLDDETTGAFNVIYASKIGIKEGNAVDDDVPIFYSPEDVDMIEHLCEAALDIKDGDGSKTNRKPVVKLVLLGDNTIVHRFILAFSAFQRLDPNLHASVHINVYLVPSQGNNDLARWLAMSDSWYQRHVFAAFSGGLNLTPTFEPQDPIPTGIAQELKVKDLLPVQKLQDLLQDYTRMANQEVQVCVFECQCWTQNGSIIPSERRKKSEDPDMIIPFITSAQIGLLVDMEVFKTRIREFENWWLTMKDVLTHDSFPSTLMPYRPKELIVHTNLEDKEKEELNQKHAAAEEGKSPSKKYTSLLFTNVPGYVSDSVVVETLDSLDSVDDGIKSIMQNPNFQNSPLQSNLKMHLREWSGITKQKLDSKNLKSSFFDETPCDSLLRSLKNDLKKDTIKTVRKVSIEGPKRLNADGKEIQESFGVMLDGVVHGPFTKVILSPMYLADQQTVVKMPIMT